MLNATLSGAWAWVAYQSPLFMYPPAEEKYYEFMLLGRRSGMDDSLNEFHSSWQLQDKQEDLHTHILKHNSFKAESWLNFRLKSAREKSSGGETGLGTRLTSGHTKTDNSHSNKAKCPPYTRSRILEEKNPGGAAGGGRWAVGCGLWALGG